MLTMNYQPPPGAERTSGSGGIGGASSVCDVGDMNDEQAADGEEEEALVGEPELAILPDGTPNPQVKKRKRFEPLFFILYCYILYC